MKDFNTLDIVGNKYNHLAVLGYSHARPKPEGNRAHYYFCECSCGNKTVVERYRIVSGNTKSCGCVNSQKKDFTGTKFGRLILIDRLKTKVGVSRATRYLCLCDCGNYLEASINSLVSGRTKSCGCWNKEYHSTLRGEKNKMWRGGSKPYPTEFNRKLKERIRDRDERKCRFPDCDYVELEDEKKLSVHHIDGSKQNCEEYNLISLCNRHHMVVEKNDPSFWEEWFYQITNCYQ